MDFVEVIEQARELLHNKGRITYRTPKRQFALDDEALDDLKEELIFSDPHITEADGRGLVWNGETERSTPSEPPAQSQPPASYTPQHLAERILAEQTAMKSRGATDGERKTITALFADLKGSTALIEGLDPEDARAIIDPALQLMMDAVHRYDGYVAQALGDGIFALFGAPIAHEDHPQRALYAALRMQEEMQGYSDQVRLKYGVPLHMRVGINTGEVVVRSIRKDDLHTDYVPVGHSTNLAARMEQLATPGSIVISEYTQKLVEGYFDLKALGAADIKGVEEPLNVYEVTGAGPLRTRFQVAARRGLSRFVGRHSELDQMRQALDQAKAGNGQIVSVMGEAGLGKSRLFYEFKLTSPSGCLVLEAFAASHGKTSPYLPLIELLKSYFDLAPGDGERKRREKVTGKVLALDRSLEDTLPYLFALLGIDDEHTNLQQMDAQIRRQRTFEALKKLLLRESLHQPVILIVEDLHWLDTETQGVLNTLSEGIASAQVFLLVNYRPEYRHEWGTKTYYTQLRLARLGKAEAEELLTFLLGSDGSLSQLKPLILERTEGTPFFLEEVIQTLVEEGALSGARGNYRLETSPTELHISPTVQGVLAARIDRLTADEKALLQQLAVIGRQFPLSLVKHVVPQPEAELYRVLSSLQAKEFLYEQPAFPEVEYLFKHALTQDVTYGTLLQDQRKTLHGQTAHALEELYRLSLDDHYSSLAHHYQLSGNTDKAVEYLGLAGQRAVQHSAHEEGARCFTAALELLSQGVETPERTGQQLTLQTALGHTLSAIKGYTDPQVEDAFTRARELCEHAGAPAQLVPILIGLGHMYNNTDPEKALANGQQLLSLCQEDLSLDGLPEAYYMLGGAYFIRGENVRAYDHAVQALHHYDPVRHHAHAFLYGVDPGVFISFLSSISLWYLGYPDQAVQQADQRLTLARDMAHPYSLGVAFNAQAFIKIFRREEHATQAQAKAIIAAGQEHGFPINVAYGTLFWGYALAMQGQEDEGRRQLQNGLAAFRALQLTFALPFFLALVAEACVKGGRSNEGLEVIEEALALAQTGQRWHEPELHRLKGELLLNDERRTEEVKFPHHSAEAEACFHTAVEVARQQGVHSPSVRPESVLLQAASSH